MVCGPYERAHALALAETVVADEELMAVVEPVLPHASVDEIRSEIELAKAGRRAEDDEDDEDDDVAVAVDEESDEDDDIDDEFADDDEEMELEEVEPTPPPSPEEVRAGFARIAARLHRRRLTPDRRSARVTAGHLLSSALREAATARRVCVRAAA